MKDFKKYALAAALSLTAFAAPAFAEEAVVVELFTSQGCSACPPADALIADLAQRKGVIALSWSVNIWDYIGWEDTLAIPLSSERHAWYNRLGGSNMVYTPQIFIDGEAAYKGNRKNKVLNAIEERRGDASTMVDIAFDPQDTGWVSLVFSAPLPPSAQVRLVFFDDVHDVAIGAGENRGRTLTYTNIVRGSKTLTLQADEAAYRVDLGSKFAKNCDAFAVLVQDSETGKMLGAAVRRLKAKTA